MEFRILGALDVSLEGGPLALGGAKPRAVLAILLLHANEVVSTDRLMDDLWGRPPETAKAALQVYIAQLRKLLEPGRARGEAGRVLITRSPGYLLRVDPDQLDSARFERLLSEARAARTDGRTDVAGDMLREALSLWRGAALEDFLYEPFAQAEIARLEELRVEALEERLDNELDRGAGAELITQLDALVGEHPLRERLRGQLMLALYRAGRQADALDAYQAAHHTLDEQLGIAPSPALQRLQREILAQDPALEGAPARRPPTGDAPPPKEARKTVTVLVTGRPPRAGMDPEALQQLHARHREAASRTIEGHGGTVQSVLADRVVGVFGIPRVHEDDALRAVRAAVELVADGASEARAGIATGEVVTSEAGAAAPSIAGEPLALAAGLDEAAAPGQVVISDETRALLGDRAHVEPAGAARGAAWCLLELVPAPPPLSRAPRQSIVGRSDELERLRASVDRLAGDPAVQLLTVIGPAGIGKTRLVEEFVAAARDDATVVAGRCVPYGEGITFWPLREVVGRLTASAPLSELLALESDAELVAERVNAAIGGTEASTSVEEMFWGFRRLLESTAAQRPLVLVIEDVHWAEPTLLDFVDYFAERGRGSVLVVCLARPELLETRPGWAGGRRNIEAITLTPLSEPESEQLIDRVAVGIPAATRARVLETAEGNPLFLEQMLAMLGEGAPADADVLLPPTIQAVLAARLDRLGPGERTAIDTAAVVGKEFSEAAVADLLPEDARPFVSRHLAALVDRELLQPVPSSIGGAALRFRHVLIQQAAYRMIPKSRRGTLHERTAEWLEKSIGSGTAEHAERAGYHLEQAYRYRGEIGEVRDEDGELARRAAALLAAAGGRAFRSGDMPASANLLGRSVALLPEDDRAGLVLRPDLGYALFEVGELEHATSVLAEAIELSRACGDRAVEWNAAVKLAHSRMYMQPEDMNAEELLRDARSAIDDLGEVGDDLGLARAWTLLGETLGWTQGNMAAAAEAYEQGAVHARRAGSPREESAGWGAVAMVLLFGPMPADMARRRTERLLEDVAGDLVQEANLAGFLASHEAMTGRFDAARAHIAQSCDRLNDLGLKWQAGIQELLGGYIETFAGDPVAAELHMRRAKESSIAIGDRWCLSGVLVDLARPIFEQGRYDDAAAAVEAIGDVPAPAADREWQIKRWGIRARLLARDGEAEEAERCARNGVAAAADTDMLWFHADALIDLTEVLRMAGRLNEAARAATEALGLYERKGIVPSAVRTRALLDELGRASVGG
jgi:DNA-binding SARP family transcriptional activator/class 3 adenylate cyclase